MPRLSYLLAAALSFVCLAPLAAAPKVTPKAATKPAPKKAAEKITCREFIALDDEFKPHVVSYALGYDKAKREDAEVIDVTGVNKVVPIIITSCKAKPNDTLLQRIRADLSHY